MEWAWSGLTGQGSGLTGQAKALACQAGLTGRLAYGCPEEKYFPQGSAVSYPSLPYNIRTFGAQKTKIITEPL